MSVGTGIYGSLSAEHVSQLQTAQSAASDVLKQYESATSSLPKACQLVIEDAMKGSLDNPMDIIAAANKTGVCEGSMDTITTITYQYHDKMLPIQEGITSANNLLKGDGSTATGIGIAAGLAAGLAGSALGLALMDGIPLGRRKVKDESAQSLAVREETSVPELTTGKSEEQSIASMQKPEESNMYIVGHEDYAYQDDMR